MPSTGFFRRLIWENRRGLGLTYSVLIIENTLHLVMPFFLGRAINDLLAGHYGGLGLFISLYVLQFLIGMARRFYDTRIFTAIYTQLVIRLIGEQKQRQVEVSKIAARSSLIREVVDFFEYYVH
ncbi:MAG: hypothetical protein OHK0053_23430 [Microscillaceae bacterium]